MRIVGVDGHHARDAFGQGREIVAGGGVVAFPTDTFYGLAVDPRLAEAVERVYTIKGRQFDQPLPLIGADLEQLERHVVVFTSLARRLAETFWPGPLTLILQGRSSIASRVHAATGRVAVRVPAEATARRLARAVGHPITATSANRSGEPAAATAEAVAATIGAAVDLLLDGGPARGGAASTIVDAGGATPALVRAGAVDWARVLESLQ